jgi:hypothetical protein
MKYLVSFLLIGLFISSCKKKEDTADPVSKDPEYYITGKVNNTLLETIRDEGDFVLSRNSFGGTRNGYSCSIIGESSDPHFQVSFSEVVVSDGDDSDELHTLVKAGTYTMSSIGATENYYSFVYYDSNQNYYYVDPEAEEAQIVIEEVTDLGGDPGEKRKIKLKGKVGSAKLYKYVGGSFTSDYVTISDVKFSVMFESVNEIE